MSFRNPPPIEPLSDISWQRIERNLLARAADEMASASRQSQPPARDRRRAIAYAATSLATVAAAIAVWAVVRGGEEAAPAEVELSRLVTEGAPTTITVGDASITAAPNTAVIVGYGEAAGAQLVLERGEVRCAVPERPGRKPFVVVAGDVRVEVVGTLFAVERVADSARIVVERGVVLVTEDGVLYTVHAGEHWPARTATAEPEPEPEPEFEPEIEMEEDLRTPRRSPRKSEPPRRVAQPEPDAAPTAKERYAAAARLESSDPAAALVIYRQLVREGGTWAANALFAQGRLELERGNKARAARLLGRYLERFPRGLNAADARNLLEQTR
jgi:hypothetical protein